MDVKRIISSDKIENNIGRVALERGPLIYCAEWPDNFGATSNLVLPPSAVFSTNFKKDLLNGVTVIQTEALAIKVDETGSNVSTRNQPFTAIPYYSWAHRGVGEMMIWLPQKVSSVDLISK
jgi:DUF1680 family protein